MLIMLDNGRFNRIRRATVIFIVVFVASVPPVLAQENALIALMTRGKDPAPTLALEKEFAAAIDRDDRAWIAAKRASIGDEFDRVLDVLEGMSEEEHTAFYIEHGAPCSVARLTMYALVTKTADIVSGQPTYRSLRAALPRELADQFAEYMGRCELLNRLPRDRRLIGKDPL